MTTEKTYVFENLIEASSNTSNIGKEIGLEQAKASTHLNAPSSLPTLSFEQVGDRARSFGNRFRSMAG